LKFGCVDAGAGAAGIDQPSVGIIVGEQQRTEIWAPAFRIGSADDDKFLAMQAFDLEPQAEPRDIVHPFVQNPGSLSVLSC